MLKMFNRLHKDEEGAALLEYGMLGSLIAIVCLTSVQLFGLEVGYLFNRITASLAGLPGA